MHARAESFGLAPATVIWLIGAMLILQPLATDLFLPTLPGIAADLQASVASTQWTMSAYVAAFAALQLVAGPLADRFGRYPIVLGGALTYVGASLLCAAAPTIEVLIAGRATQAVGTCATVVAARAIVRDLYPPQQGAHVLASASVLMAFGPLAGPLIAAYLYVQFGWRSSFLFLAACGLAVTAFALARLKETNDRPNPRALALGPMLVNYAALLRAPAFVAYTALLCASYGGLFAYLSGSSFVLIRVLGLSPTAYAWTFATMSVGFLAGTLLGRQLVARFGIPHTVQIGAALQAAAGVTMALLALAGVIHVAAIAAPMFLFGVSHGTLQPSAQAGAVAPYPERAGAASALMGCLMMLAAVGSGTLVGATYNGTVYPLTLTIAGTSLACLLFAFTLVRRFGRVH